MKSMTNIAAFAAVAALVTVNAVYAVPEVSNVKMTQREGSRIVDIEYDLTGEAAIVTLGIETNGVAIPDRAVTRLLGDVCKVVQTGSCSIVWNVGADWSENLTQVAKPKVTAWSTNSPPQVMVADLSKGTTATQEDPYPIFYYSSFDALPGGGLSNAIYKSSMLVMHKIPSGIYEMGDEGTLGESVCVTLTKEFYVGVYQVTQKQWGKVTGADPSQFKDPFNPVEAVSYEDIRGAVEQGAGHEWPSNDNVYAESFIGRMRNQTGLMGFDLPTEAQWEYACRAGTTTYYNDGIKDSSTNQLDELGWWKDNTKSSAYPKGSPSTVGQKTPNAWGLYDMHGNVWEWCLDWNAGLLTGGSDPKGAESGSIRVKRGGSWSGSALGCRSAYRIGNEPSYLGNNGGFRLVRNLP